MHDSSIAWMMAGGTRTDQTPDTEPHGRRGAEAAASRHAEGRLPRLSVRWSRSDTSIAAFAGPDTVASPTLHCCPA